MAALKAKNTNLYHHKKINACGKIEKMEYDCGIERTSSFDESTGYTSFENDSVDESSNNKTVPIHESDKKSNELSHAKKSRFLPKSIKFAGRFRNSVSE